MDSERSKGSLLMAVIAVGFLAWSVLYPWYSYDYSSGRRTPPGGFQDENDTGVIRHEMDFYADRWEGDVEPTDEEEASRLVTWINWGVLAAIVALALVSLGELPWIARVVSRPVGLGLYIAGFSAVSLALAIAWFQLPDTLSGYGVNGAWTYFLEEPDGYTRTNIARGWAAAAIALAFMVAGFLFKFQAGSADSSLVEQYAQGEKA